MKKITKILSLSLAFMLSLATAIPTVSVAADPTTGGNGVIRIQAYSVTNGEGKTDEKHKDMTGRSFTAYRILEGYADTTNPDAVRYKVPDNATMQKFYQEYDGFDSIGKIALTENRLIAQVDPSTSVQAAAYDNKMSGVDIMKAIAEIDPKVEFVGPVQSSESDIMPMDIGGLTDDALDEAVLENLNGMDDGSEELQAFADAALAKAKEAGLEAYTSTVEALDGTDSGANAAFIKNLKYGYYVIEETTAGGSGKAISTTLLTAVHATETVKLISKDVAPTVKKYINSDTKLNDHTPTADLQNNSAEIGETINYKIVANLPDVQGYTSYTYKVEDTLSEGLDFQDGTVKVWYYPTKDTEVSDPIAASNYTANYVEGTRTLTININSDWILDYGIDGIKNEHNHGTGSKPETSHAEQINIPYIVITYSAKVNKDAVLKNTNTVKITYSNNPSPEEGDDGLEDTPPDETNTYVYAVNLIKTGFKNGGVAYLKDAEFKLKKGKLYANLIPVDDGYSLDPDDPWNATGTTIKSVDTAAGVKIKGLEAGIYAFEETKAPPDGYERIEKDIEFTISVTGENNSYDEPGFSKGATDSSLVTVAKSTTAGVGNVTVENIIDGLLPGTGGVGRVMVYALGSILVLGAAVLFVLKRRSGKNA